MSLTLNLCGGETTQQTTEQLQPTTADDVDNSDDLNHTLTEEQEYVQSLTFPLQPSPTDPDGIPQRYLLMAKQHRTQALHAFQATLAWRASHGIDTILSRPHVKYDQVKAIFPHYFPGRDVHGNIVFVQRVGQIRLDLKHALNVTNDDMYHHFIYVLEYCWNILQPDDTITTYTEHDTSPSSTTTTTSSVMTSVLDLSGVSFSTLHNKEIMSFVQHVVTTMSHHYPSRSHKTLLINAPRWFGGIYSVIKPILRESTRQKIEIYSGGMTQDDALRRVLNEDCLPMELLSTSSKNKKGGGGMQGVSTGTDQLGPNSLEEQQLREFCVKHTERAGEQLLPV